MSVSPYLSRSDDGEVTAFLGSLMTTKVPASATGGRLTVVDFLNPPGFAPPVHRHQREDEIFYLLDGEAVFHCEGQALAAGPGDLVMLPVGLPHTFVVGAGGSLRCLQITTPGGFEDFANAVGERGVGRVLPDSFELDPAALGHAAARHGIEILGPPPAP